MPAWTALKKQQEMQRDQRKFGWDDLFDLLQTAAGAYGTFQGVKQGRARTALSEDELAFRQDKETYDQGRDEIADLRQGRLDTLAQEKHEVGMQETGYYRRDPAEQGPMPADTQMTSGGWIRAPEPEYPEVPGSVHLGGGNYRTDESYLNDYERARMASMAREDAPATLTPWQRGERIEGGWVPEGQATTYDLDTQMPMREGQPRPVVGGLVAPPMPEGPVDPNPITFTGAQVVSLAAKAADPLAGGSAIYDEMGNAYSALSNLAGAGAGTTSGLTLTDILAGYPTITLTTADLNVLEQMLQRQGPAAVRAAIEQEFR